MVRQFLPCENATLLELISTDNKVFNKVMTVLAALCSEMGLLVHEADTRLYSALLCYAEGGKYLGQKPLADVPN